MVDGLIYMESTPRIYTRQEWAQLTPEERGPCDEWPKYRNRDGYGHCTFEKKSWLTHRLAWLQQVGSIPPETPCVLHHCDNRICRRISHLFLGTVKDNAEDMCSKGRVHHRISDDARRVIRARVKAGETQASLAVEFGVVGSRISQIVTMGETS